MRSSGSTSCRWPIRAGSPSDPELAWGFYGHRLMLYRETEPHEGFAILHRWMSRMPRGGFVYTSNVDGHFQKAGFSPEQVYEVHGTIGAMQCLGECGAGIFSAEPHSVNVDHEHHAGRSSLAEVPEVRRAGTAEHPHVRRLGLGLVARGGPAAAAEVLAGLDRRGPARRRRVRRRHRDPHRATRLRGRSPAATTRR